MAHSTREDNRPSFAFYPDDWLTDAGLIISEPEERGVWIDMLCFMFKSPIRGAMLNPDGSKMDSKKMAKLLRIPENRMAKILANLLANRVARKLEDGTIVNWRMYRKDKDLSQKRSEAGFKGAIAKWEKEGDGKPMASEMANDGKDGLTEKKKNIEEVIVKEKYLEFVYLSIEQFKQLEDRFGKERTQEYIERLNNYIGSKGKKYKSHYHTILNWANKDEQEGKGGTNKSGGVRPVEGKYASAIRETKENTGKLAEGKV